MCILIFLQSTGKLEMKVVQVSPTHPMKLFNGEIGFWSLIITQKKEVRF